MTQRMRRVYGGYGLALLIAASLWAAPAAAQTPTPLTSWQLSVGEVLAKQGGSLPAWRITLGGGVDFDPLYEGSKRYHALPSVVFDVRYRDIFFISDGEGAGVNLVRGENYRGGVAIAYDLGRDHHIQHRLTGLGNVDVTPEAKAFFDYFFKAVVLSLDLRQGLGGNNGLVGDVGLYVPLEVPAVEDFYVFTGPSMTLADDRYMQVFFGVNAEQASRSQFHEFTARGGIYRAGWGVTAVHRMTDHWWVEVEGAWQYLVNDAARSPIVEERTELNAGFNVLYRF